MCLGQQRKREGFDYVDITSLIIRELENFEEKKLLYILMPIQPALGSVC